MNTPEKIKITVETLVLKPVEDVWNSWTTPEHITRWNQASEDWHTPFAENDLREGGRFKSTMAAKDGSMSFDFTGVYTKVVPHQEIAYTIDDGRTVTVAFKREGAHTAVTEIFEAESMNAPEMQKAGWQAILDNFKQYTEAL
jgi:uncharacterized protein YndB with AHSA1/START domain